MQHPKPMKTHYNMTVMAHSFSVSFISSILRGNTTNFTNRHNPTCTTHPHSIVPQIILIGNRTRNASLYHVDIINVNSTITQRNKP